MRFFKESRIPAAPGEVFAFHEAAGALQRLTPPWETVEVIHDDGSLRPGSRVVLRTWLGPLPLRWVAEHTEYDPPHGFADRQVKGPFASWHHRHRFDPDGAGGTWLRDEIDYELPLGFLGRWLGAKSVRARLERLFAHRHRVTLELLAAAKSCGSGGEHKGMESSV